MYLETERDTWSASFCVTEVYRLPPWMKSTSHQFWKRMNCFPYVTTTVMHPNLGRAERWHHGAYVIIRYACLLSVWGQSFSLPSVSNKTGMTCYNFILMFVQLSQHCHGKDLVVQIEEVWESVQKILLLYHNSKGRRHYTVNLMLTRQLHSPLYTMSSLESRSPVTFSCLLDLTAVLGRNQALSGKQPSWMLKRYECISCCFSWLKALLTHTWHNFKENLLSFEGITSKYQ